MKNKIKTYCICWHGTDKKNIESILENGFSKHTFFARHLEDALGYGGKYIFEVAFEKKKLPNYWEFITRNKVSPRRIIQLRYYQRYKVLKENKKLREKVFKSNL